MAILERVFNDIAGIVRIRLIPADWTHEEYMARWLSMSEHQRDKYTQHEFKNVITANGLNACNTFLASYGTTSGFALWLALGNGALNAVTQNDTHLVNETFRVQPSSATIVGNISTVSTVLNQSAQVGVFTEIGLYGVGATSTLGSGQLNTHLLAPFQHYTQDKLSVDYSLTRN